MVNFMSLLEFRQRSSSKKSIFFVLLIESIQSIDLILIESSNRPFSIFLNKIDSFSFIENHSPWLGRVREIENEGVDLEGWDFS